MTFDCTKKEIIAISLVFYCDLVILAFKQRDVKGGLGLLISSIVH